MAVNEPRKMHPGFMRNAKVIGIIMVLAGLGVVGAFMMLKHRNDQPAAVDIPSVDAHGGKATPETPRYTQTLNRANQAGLAQAEQTTSTFIPALSDNNQNDQIAKQLAQRTDATQSDKIDYRHPQNQAQSLPALPAPVPGVNQEVAALASQWEVAPQAQEVLGLQKQAQALAASSPTAASSPVEAKAPLIKATAKYYAHLENGINTDAPSDVLAVLDEGPCKGAEMTGTGKLTGETVTASFTTLECNEKTESITAVALNDNTLSNALPADIDHHVISRVAIPALLGALGAAGSVYSSAGSTVMQNPLGGSSTTTNPNPGLKQVAGAGVSGASNGVQTVIQQEVASIPPITGRVEMNTPILILFKTDVATP